MSSLNAGFGPDQPSRTSIVVAALRAFGAREPDPSVRNPDFLAERLVTAAELQLITEHPISQFLKEDYQKGRENREVAGMSNLMLVRTKFVDDRMRQALENGAAQVVILGAGLDTRAYRYAELLRDKKVFEVDYRSTQQLKKRRLPEALGSVPSHVRFAEIDFKRDTLEGVLHSAGYQSSQRTFFIWEGVSMYLAEEAVRRTLRTIARHSAAGSSLVMDFAGRAMIDMLERFPNLPQHKYTTEWGEPWIFGLPDAREREFFRECGLELYEVFSFFGSEASKRYLTRSDGTKFGRVRGGAPQRDVISTMARMMWRFFTTKSYWYALAEVVVPPKPEPKPAPKP
jgi:methyltransferase (TIGR00027 family)